MQVKQLVDTHIKDYRTSNDNYIAKYCPFCGGGQNNDKYTFGVNAETGAYNCFRGKCDVSGSIKDLAEHFGEEVSANKREYKKPTAEIDKLKGKAKEYVLSRGITEETIQKCDIGQKDSMIAFKYYRNRQPQLLKYRSPDKKKKFRAEKGGRPVLWLMDWCDTKEPLIICEGEFDAMCVKQAGYKNATSIPFGTNNMDWIEECWEFIEKFDEVIIWADNDEAGKKMVDKAVTRIGRGKTKIVKSQFKDANEVLYRLGEEEVVKAIENAEYKPVDNVIRMADVTPIDYSNIPAYKSCIPRINKILGGYMLGYITVWTGSNSSGKSTYLGQEILEAIDQNKGVGLYSGELTEGQVQNWISRQAAGPDYLEFKENKIKEEAQAYVPEQIQEMIKGWYGNNFFYFELTSGSHPDKILDTFEGLYKQYGIEVFVIDNIMTIEYGGSRSEYYHQQSQFITKCKNFASRLGVHIHIVAHPKKTKGKVEKEDIAGLYEITNKADNVVVMHRVTAKNSNDFPDKIEQKYCELNNSVGDKTDINVLEILKSRIYGQQDVMIPVGFEPESKRFYPFEQDELRFKQYSWGGNKNDK